MYNRSTSLIDKDQAMFERDACQPGYVVNIQLGHQVGPMPLHGVPRRATPVLAPAVGSQVSGCVVQPSVILFEKTGSARVAAKQLPSGNNRATQNV
jgi:hypothetical protein